MDDEKEQLIFRYDYGSVETPRIAAASRLNRYSSLQSSDTQTIQTSCGSNNNKRVVIATVGALLIYVFIAVFCGWSLDQC